jgi:hypothetical protein
MKSIKNLLIAGIVIFAFALTSCYKEGAKISFRSKRDRIANEWSLVEYKVDGNPDQAMKDAWKSGDSMELLFIITKSPTYGFGLQYTKSYSDAHNGAVFSSNRPEQPATYQIIQNNFRNNVPFHNKLARGGNWTFADKFRHIRFGIIGNPDVAYDDATDILEAKIIMLKDKGFKLEWVNDDNKTHTMEFEPRFPNAVK